MRLLRSVLFTPGLRGDRYRKALESGAADVVVADLEDAVAPAEKAEARGVVRDALESVRDSAGAVPAVRVNPVGSGLVAADLAAVMPARPRLIVVPKAERVGHVAAIDEAIARHERAVAVPRGSTPLLLIIETARGVLEAARLARASPRVIALAFGAEDLAADAGLRRSAGNEEVHAARSRVALAAASARIAAVDQVYVDIDDEEGLAREARQARALGYRGKMLIHPKQVPVVHGAFAPTDEEVKNARRLLAAAGSGDAGEGGVLRFEGRMIDVPLIEQARRVVAEHEAAGSQPRTSRPEPQAQ